MLGRDALGKPGDCDVARRSAYGDSWNESQALHGEAMGFTSFNPSYALMLFAPAGTLRPIVDKLNAALARAKLQKTFADGGMDEHPPEEETPEAAAALLGRGDPRQPHLGAVGILAGRP